MQWTPISTVGIVARRATCRLALIVALLALSGCGDSSRLASVTKPETISTTAPTAVTKPRRPVTISYRVPDGTRLSYRLEGHSTLANLRVSGNGPAATPATLEEVKRGIAALDVRVSGSSTYSIASINPNGSRHVSFTGEFAVTGIPDFTSFNATGAIEFTKDSHAELTNVRSTIEPSSGGEEAAALSSVVANFEMVYVFLYGKTMSVDAPRVQDLPTGSTFGGLVAKTPIHVVTTFKGRDSAGNNVFHISAESAPGKTPSASPDMTVVAHFVTETDLVLAPDGRPISGTTTNTGTQDITFDIPDQQSTIKASFDIATELTLSK